MKETEGWVKIKKYTDNGRPVCGSCSVCGGKQDAYVREGKNPWQRIPGPFCPVWHGESKSEWQPIETAPNDGTPIWAWSAEYGQRETRMNKYGKGSPGFEKWKRGEGPLSCGWDWIEPKQGYGHTWKPTHWMPLPSPPQEKKTMSEEPWTILNPREERLKERVVQLIKERDSLLEIIKTMGTRPDSKPEQDCKSFCKLFAEAKIKEGFWKECCKICKEESAIASKPYKWATYDEFKLDFKNHDFFSAAIDPFKTAFNAARERKEG